ncbi:coiled-coil domain-containing protein 150-like isoform X5 [Rhinoraja longicauda]
MTTDALNMSHATIPPIHIGATVPESFTVLQHRIIAAEEQTDALIQELESLGFGVEASGVPKIDDYNSHRPVSPLHARKAFGVESDVLWKNYEFLVSRVCRLESVIQTMKLNVFRIQTAKELNPEYSVDQLAALQEEHVQEVKKIQRDIMRFRQQLNEVSEEKEAAEEEIERLSAALEITTTTKTNMVMAAEELKATNTRMSQKMQEVSQQLVQEVNLRKALEESHINLLQRVQELDKVVEIERKQVKVLQQDSLAFRKNEQLTQERLQQELQKASDFEKIQKQLKMESDAKQSIISLLADEGKKTQLMLKNQQEENAKLQNEIASLRNMVVKLQDLNDQLDAQCTEMSDTLRSLSVENAKLITEHETSLKDEQEKMKEKMHEQELLLDAARANISADLQCAVNEKHQLKNELEALRVEYMETQQKFETMQKRAITQQMLLESEVAHLKENLKISVNECEHIKKEKETQMDQAKNTIDNITKEKNILEKQVTENQSKVQKLQEELQCRFDAGFENDQLRKVNTLLETKYSQIQLVLEQKVKDLALTVLSHDQALSDTRKLKEHIEMMEDKERQKIANLQRQLTDSKQDNSQMAATVENVLSSHRQLQQTMEKLQMELGQRIMDIHSLQKDKSHAQILLQRLQAELEDLQGKLANMEAQHSIQLRKALDETTSKSADLSRTNRELRLRVTEFEKTTLCLKAKIKDQKTQLKHYLETKKTTAQNTERIKEFEADLKQMEIIKDQYQKKNNEQSQMILTFRKEMQILQDELQNVAKSQNEAESLYRQQEIQLKKERKLSRGLRNKCQGLEEKVKNLQNCTEETEHKLKEASLESQQISANLEEAHKWFKSKFDRLQAELIKTREVDTSKDQLCNGENFKKTSRELCLSSRQKSKATAGPADARRVMRHRKSSTSPERDDLT